MFYAVRESDEKLLEEMDEVIDAHCKKNGEAFKGEIPVGSMVFAPYEYEVKDQKELMYHRAVILSPFHENDAESYVVIQYCDYGSIRRIQTSRLYAVPDDLTVGDLKIIQIPLLAVKYRLRGITASTGEPFLIALCIKTSRAHGLERMLSDFRRKEDDEGKSRDNG